MTITDVYHVGPRSLSLAWGNLLLRSLERGVKSMPATVSITDFGEDGNPIEISAIRSAVDDLIQSLRQAGDRVNSVDVSALVVFPFREWTRKGRPSHAEFAPYCVNRYGTRLRKLDPRNRSGTYFIRMMNFGGTRADGGAAAVDQIGEAIRIWKHYAAKGKRPRQAGMQFSCFDPCKDITLQPRQAFPCLHQVGLTWEGDSLALSAFYPTQYIVERAYGNYLGLCHLGIYIAEQLNMKLVRVNCFIGCAILNVNKTDNRLRPVIEAIKSESESELAE